MAGDTVIRFSGFNGNQNALISLPISKSLSNRVLILEKITGNQLGIKKFSEARDTEILQNLLSQTEQTQEIDVEDAGTVARFMLAYCATIPERTFHLHGTYRMHQRPIAPLVNALRALGCEIQYLREPGFLPLTIKSPRELKSETELDTSLSSQFLSALLLISPKIKTPFSIKLSSRVASLPYAKMTASIIEQYGYTAHFSNVEVIVEKMGKAQEYDPEKLTEGDWSAAIYFLLINALGQGINITIPNISINSLQGDSDVDKLLVPLGIEVFQNSEGISSRLIEKPNTCNLDLANNPDLAQPIITYMVAKKITGSITGLHTLGHKETDRLKALEVELSKIGAIIRTDSGSLSILSYSGQPETSNYTLETYNDHRMAMSFFLLQLVNPNIGIRNPEVVGKSFPSFWTKLEQIGFTFEHHNDAV